MKFKGIPRVAAGYLFCGENIINEESMNISLAPLEVTPLM
jgi:hypothetical protein